MAKKKVDDPFVQMFELKGLKANEALMVCKVWSFQSNGLECFISNNTWADFLGCSNSTVNRIKIKLEKQEIIERDEQYLRLKVDMSTLINRLNKQYVPKNKKTEQKLPYWQIEKSNQNDVANHQPEHTPSQIEEGDMQVESKVVQIDNQLYKREDNIIENLEETVIPEIWSLVNFNYLNITSINQIHFDTVNKVELRNLVLSYWYNCFSTIELVKPINLFLNETYFNIFTRILRETSTGRLNPEYLHEVNINCFFDLIQVYHTMEQDELPNGATVPLRQVVKLIVSQILEIVHAVIYLTNY
jgi:DNA-binding Lrp family transcriptional regulator